MSAVVFAGPSLHGRPVPPRQDILLRPPAAQGDIYRACQLQPAIVGLIDGVFEGVPSVWHKEILWALAQGIAVYGSASMGALRAAELDSFGMTGIGVVYQWYRDGVIEDDEEVALLHGPADAGFMPLSEPSVNVRATCAAAVAAGIVDQAAADMVIAAAKSLHYKDRLWRAVMDRAAASGLDPAVCKGLVGWLDMGKIDQKQRDALALVEAVAAALDAPAGPRQACFRFEWTDLWDQVKRQWDGEGPLPGLPPDCAAAVIDELRLDPDAYAAMHVQAVARAALLARADGPATAIDRRARQARLARLRESLGLLRKSDLDAWAARNDLDGRSLEALLDTELRLDAARRLPAELVEREILALLKLGDDYAGLAERARDKQHSLRSAGRGEDGLPHGVTVPMLLDWYFVKHLGQPVPDDLDSAVEGLGLASRTAFYRLLAAEYVYIAAQGGG